MTIDSQDELEALLRVGKIVGSTLQEVQALVRPGVTTRELDEEAERILRRHGARSAPPLVYGFPGTLCISVNDEAAHGVPGDRHLAAGDLVKLDLTALLDGYMADAAVTVAVGEIMPARRRLMTSAHAALSAAIGAATAGARLRDVGAIVEAAARRHGSVVVRELCGHGIGRTIHEAPHCIPSYFDPRASDRLHAGTVIALEPHLTTASGRIETADDGWTLRTVDRKVVANFEHTVVVTDGKPIILTAA